MNIDFIAKRIEHWNLKKITRIFVSLAIIIGLGAAYFGYDRVYMDEERRFWTAINNSMATPSVTRTLTEGGSGNQVIQQYRFHYAPQRVIENKVSFAERSATVDTFVETEGILYPGEQFLRYVDFQADNNGDTSLNIDDVLNDWAYQSAGDIEDGRLTYLSEQVTLAIFGNFTAVQRAEFIEKLQDSEAYAIDFTQVQLQEIDDEEVYVVPVTINLRPYVTALQESFITAGYGDFPPLDPENYQDGSTVNAQFLVSKNNTISRISFGNRQEIYSNYGVVKQIERPEASRSILELQAEVESILQ